MRYRSQNKVDLETYQQIVYCGYDSNNMRRDLAKEIINKMSDEDFDKIFTTTVENIVDHNIQMIVRVELNVK